MDPQPRRSRTPQPAPPGPLPAHVTQDAVVVVPGIMGSELKDTTTGRHLWGLHRASWYVNAWTRPGGLDALRLTEDELEGRTGRIVATGLLSHSAWTPYLRGVEPYTDLLALVRSCVADDAAILPFAYDWRLPVATNARLLADRARRHLTAWRRHPAQHLAREHRVDQRPARLVFVAHSMGGLVARAALDGGYDSELATDTRGVITLGTPFHGAVKAAVILNTGRGAPVPLPHRKLRAICATMPGLHDLLPQYRSVRDGGSVRHLTPGDVAALGGDADLARESAAFHLAQRQVKLPDHRAVVGTNQPTWQSLTLRDGRVEAHLDGARQNTDGTFVSDRRGRVRYFQVHGDGTVYKESAALGPAVTTLPLQHGAVAKDRSALEAVAEILREDVHLGPPQGDPGCGLSTPDLVEAGRPWTLSLRQVDSLAGLTCRITDVEDSREESAPLLGWLDGGIGARVTLDRPGLYRVGVRTLDGFTVTQLVLATEPGQRLEESA
ncbi:esterase/lipase family protein [Streptomyces sp. HMX112]|uniref:esterase/lipase family protein n=1 Tax=Streptomyces sp. HMX112 TaxID=3390850 RepID=UPI003A801D83